MKLVLVRPQALGLVEPGSGCTPAGSRECEGGGGGAGGPGPHPGGPGDWLGGAYWPASWAFTWSADPKLPPGQTPPICPWCGQQHPPEGPHGPGSQPGRTTPTGAASPPAGRSLVPLALLLVGAWLLTR